MRKATALLTFIFFLVSIISLVFAPPLVRAVVWWTITAMVVALALAAIAASWLGVAALRYYVSEKSRILPNDNGDLPVIREKGRWVNLNVPPEGATEEEVWAWAIYRATCGKNGSPPASLFGAAPAPQQNDFPMVDNGLLIEAVAEEL